MSALIVGAQPPRPGPDFEIVRLRKGRSIEGVILSPHVWGYITHWVKRGKSSGFSVECKKGRAACLCDAEELPNRWKGYLHLFDTQRKREVFLELTPAACEVLLAFTEAEKSYRGFSIRATRGKGGDNSRLWLHFLSPVRVAWLDRLPASRDPRPYLEKLWSYTVNPESQQEAEQEELTF